MPVNFDTESLYQFLKDTPESGLKKMLVDNKPMTDVHFNLLMKVVRNCTHPQFATHCEQSTFPTMKFSPKEDKLKETFWKDCTTTFTARGLLQPANAKKVA